MYFFLTFVQVVQFCKENKAKIVASELQDDVDGGDAPLSETIEGETESTSLQLTPEETAFLQLGIEDFDVKDDISRDAFKLRLKKLYKLILVRRFKLNCH